MLDAVRRDLRHAVRQLLRSPGGTLVAGLALTLGIGLTTAIFSFVRGFYLRGLPFDAPHQIVALGRTHAARGVARMEVSIHDFRDWQAGQRVFSELAAYYAATVNLSGGEKPERYAGAFVTANTFRLLRARPLLGRTFAESEERVGADPVIVLGYAVWRDRYAKDPAIVGKTVRANGEPATVIGVMPEKFGFPFAQEVWLPMRLDALALPRGEGQTVEGVGRLRDGVSVAEAGARMNALARRLAIAHPETNEGIGVLVQPYIQRFVGPGVTLMYTMLGAVFLVLLVACANVANLLLSRAAVRAREVGIRTALGASRARVAAQFLVEALVLAGAGAVLGTGVAWVGVVLLRGAFTRVRAPFWMDVRLDGASLLFVLAMTFVAALVSGLLPALQASRADVSAVLKDEARGTSSFRLGRLSRAIVVLELALSCGLLVGAGLTTKSVTTLDASEFGFETRRVFTARVRLPEAQYPDAASEVRFFDALQARVAALPGAERVSLASVTPGVLKPPREPVAIGGRAYAAERDYPLTSVAVVAPGWFGALGLAPRRGRDFTAADREGAPPVAIVNESFARRYFPGRDPVGERVRTGGARTTAPWRTIVGVTPDVHVRLPDDPEPDGLYVPMAQAPERLMTVVVRARGDPLQLTTAVRDAVAAIDPDLPIYYPGSLAGAIAEATWFYHLFASIFAVFGVVALFLASVGLYGVMAFSVSRRTREMGIRMALGARARGVVGLILRQGAGQIAVGLVLGLSLAAGVSNLLTLLLYEVNPRDPAVFGAVVVTLLGTGLAACVVPARRATRVDPLTALRSE